jgi:hypothetical protein
VIEHLAAIEARLDQIEEKLDALLKALAEEPEDDAAVRSLDGRVFPARDDGRSLG